MRSLRPLLSGRRLNTHSLQIYKERVDSEITNEADVILYEVKIKRPKIWSVKVRQAVIDDLINTNCQ